mmetsp:Transcript_44405/g.65895  ORF Transcript_44405/g.65895 Transcript_44405/m.65895 type:complete len:101 (-) Transcript_44405:378-680(-)
MMMKNMTLKWYQLQKEENSTNKGNSYRDKMDREESSSIVYAFHLRNKHKSEMTDPLSFLCSVYTPVFRECFNPSSYVYYYNIHSYPACLKKFVWICHSMF